MSDSQLKYLDKLKDYQLNPAHVQAWLDGGLCLCGCGQKTTITRRETSQGRPNFFKVGHSRRVRDPWVGSHLTPQQRARMIAAVKKARGVEACGIMGLVDEYLDEHPMRDKEFAALAGVQRGLFCQLRTRKRTRMAKTTAVKLLIAIGEPVNRSLLEKSGYAKSKARTGSTRPS